jgi:short-subunit dehydrogenase
LAHSKRIAANFVRRHTAWQVSSKTELGRNCTVLLFGFIMTTIAGKTIVLTGASRGIGALLATILAQEKMVTIVGISRSACALDTVGEAVTAAGGRWIGIPFDISQLDQLPRLVQKIRSVTSSIDILINNAGIEIYRAFQDYSMADLQAVIGTNLLAAMELSRLLLPKMLQQQNGHIVNIASLAAKKGHPYDSIYSASKAGLFMWSDALRQELVGTGVEVSIVCPGYVSDQGLMADTGIPAPKLVGTSTADQVAKVVMRAIRRNQAEVLINQDWVTTLFTKGLLLSSQLFPRVSDRLYRALGIGRSNQNRIAAQQHLTSESVLSTNIKTVEILSL